MITGIIVYIIRVLKLIDNTTYSMLMTFTISAFERCQTLFLKQVIFYAWFVLSLRVQFFKYVLPCLRSN